MSDLSQFLLDDPAVIRALAVSEAVLTERDRLRQITNDPAAQRYRTIAHLLAFETSITAAQARDILSKLK